MGEEIPEKLFMVLQITLPIGLVIFL